MIKIENIEICGWKPAIRGMRNPMNSWNKSDSVIGHCMDEVDCKDCPHGSCWECNNFGDYITKIGDKDLELMLNLREAGTDHRKFMRMIVVYVDITAPLYWWKEYDTYKVGTVANSCSTMHKIADKKFTIDDFSHEKLIDFEIIGSLECDGKETEFEQIVTTKMTLDSVIQDLNLLREKYLETKEKKYWYAMIQLLPTSYNQKRTVMLNYEVLANIYKSRKNHKLDEWVGFCKWIETLPHSEIITGRYKIFKCARCGKTERVLDSNLEEIDNWSDLNGVCLCPECTEAYSKWFKEGNNDGN